MIIAWNDTPAYSTATIKNHTIILGRHPEDTYTVAWQGRTIDKYKATKLEYAKMMALQHVADYLYEQFSPFILVWEIIQEELDQWDY